MAGELVGTDEPTMNRVLAATRRVESMPILSPSTRNRPQFSVSQIIVPRSGPDGNDMYTCDIYIVNDPITGTYTQVSTGQKMILLPSTL